MSPLAIVFAVVGVAGVVVWAHARPGMAATAIKQAAARETSEVARVCLLVLEQRIGLPLGCGGCCLLPQIGWTMSVSAVL
jgi:hypothetical protein